MRALVAVGLLACNGEDAAPTAMVPGRYSVAMGTQQEGCAIEVDGIINPWDLVVEESGDGLVFSLLGSDGLFTFECEDAGGTAECAGVYEMLRYCGHPEIIPDHEYTYATVILDVRQASATQVTFALETAITCEGSGCTEAFDAGCAPECTATVGWVGTLVAE